TLETKTNIDRCSQADAIPRNRVIALCYGLQPKIIQKYLVPRQSDAHPFVFQQIRIEHGAATKSFPQDTDIAARDCHQHERRKDDADQRCHEQVDDQCWQLALYKTPPCKARSARGWLIVNGHQMGIHCSARSLYMPSPDRHRRFIISDERGNCT